MDLPKSSTALRGAKLCERCSRWWKCWCSRLHDCTTGKWTRQLHLWPQRAQSMDWTFVERCLLWLYCIVLYYQLFQNMEDSGILNVDDEVHLLFLHYVFLPRINDSLQQFVSMWNPHPLWTESNLSLIQLRMTGEHPCDNHNDLDAEVCFNCTQCIAFVV